MNILRRLQSVLLPDLCAVCRRELQEGERYVCLSCLGKIPYSRGRGKYIAELGPLISNSRVPVGLVRSWYLYDAATPFADLIRNAKYYGLPEMARALGRLFARDLLRGPVYGGEVPAAAIDVLLPMPMHPSKLRRRGYNQAREICLGMAEVMEIPVGDNLVAVRPHSTQTHLSHEERAANIAGCFAVRHSEELDGLNVAVVDDVITTGASMAECLLLLNRCNHLPASVSILSVGLSVGRGGG